MSSGILLSLLLSYNLMSFGSGTLPDVDARIRGGYHVGPFYALASLETLAHQQALAWQYNPELVTYDFQLGAKWRGIDVHLSRYCVHGIDQFIPGGEPAGLRLVVSYDSWLGEQ